MNKDETQQKVDIFDFLKRVDNSDLSYYDELSEQEKKSLSMVVAARWLACTKNKRQVVLANELVNPFVYKFATKHRELLYRLMLISSSGTEKRYAWISKKKTVSSRPNSVKAISQYYGISSDKAEGYLSMFSLEDVIDCADSLGYDEQTIKKIKNEYK